MQVERSQMFHSWAFICQGPSLAWRHESVQWVFHFSVFKGGLNEANVHECFIVGEGGLKVFNEAKVPTFLPLSCRLICWLRPGPCGGKCKYQIPSIIIIIIFGKLQIPNTIIFIIIWRLPFGGKCKCQVPLIITKITRPSQRDRGARTKFKRVYFGGYILFKPIIPIIRGRAHIT